VNGFDIDLIAALSQKKVPTAEDLPLGKWHDARGNWRLPYAAGIPGEVRFIYLPYFGFKQYPMPTVRALEPGRRYHAYYWEPSLGIKFDLGTVEHAGHGAQRQVDGDDLDRKLYDANGRYRGELSGGAGWDDYGRKPQVEMDTYKPEKPPAMGDWVLVLEARK
jgi:hypothetical protein